MDMKIQSIPLDMIKPVFNLKVYDSFINRMQKMQKNLSTFDCLLAVEENLDNNTYVLVGGYDKYNYLLSIKSKTAACIIETTSRNKVELYYKMLRRLMNKGDSLNENKKFIINQLKSISFSPKHMEEYAGILYDKLINNYSYNDNIPKKYINRHTSETIMNLIESLPIKEEVKHFLYEKASLSPMDSNKLIQDDIVLIDRFLKQEPRFYTLTSEQQIIILNYIVNFKNESIRILKSVIDGYYKPENS